MEKVVSTALKLGDTQKLELNSVQTQNIESRYLAPTGSSTGKKADFVLAFTAQESDVNTAYRAFTSRHGHKSLSPMTDAYTSELAFACAFELKEPNGAHSEAEAQLATLHIAMLLKLEDLAHDAGAILKLPALVAWVVVGHNWFCYISTLCPDGSIACTANNSWLKDALTSSYRRSKAHSTVSRAAPKPITNTQIIESFQASLHRSTLRTPLANCTHSPRHRHLVSDHSHGSFLSMTGRGDLLN